MIRARRAVGWAVLAMAVAALPGAAAAGQRLAIFPFDMSLPTTEEDFFRGVSGPSPEEKNRLALAHAELSSRLGAANLYEIIDLKPIEAEIAEAAPIYECNRCELKLGAKANAELVMTSLVDKISETHLSLTVAIIDVAEKRIVNKASVLIQGNTDESWLHGVRWLVKNRLLAESKSQ